MAITWSYGANHAIVLGKAGTNTVIEITLNGGSTAVASGATSLSYQIALLRPLDHSVTNVEDTVSFNVGVTLSDGANPVVFGTISVTIEDDMPASIYSEHVHVEDLATAPDVTGQLNFISGADGVGTVRFDAGALVGHLANDTAGNQLTFNGQNLYLHYGLNTDSSTDFTTLVAATTNSSAAISKTAAGVGYWIDIDGASNTYTLHANGVINNGTAISSSEIATVGGGNKEWKAFIDLSGTTQDAILTTKAGDSVNTNQ